MDIVNSLKELASVIPDTDQFAKKVNGMSSTVKNAIHANNADLIKGSFVDNQVVANETTVTVY